MVVGLQASTSLRQLEYEEKVLKELVAKVGGIFVQEDEPAYQTWIGRAANEWLRFGNAQRLARPSDNFSIGTSNVDSIDMIVFDIMEGNKVARDLLEGPKHLGKDFVQPLSVHGGWISPQEYGYWCLMTTDVFPDQAPEQAKEAIEIIGNITRKQIENKSSAAIIHLLGPAYDMLGPMFGNIHLIMKKFKNEFDPYNLSNPGFATRPDVVSPEELQKMAGGH